jgi:hypothetical protein
MLKSFFHIFVYGMGNTLLNTPRIVGMSIEDI